MRSHLSAFLDLLFLPDPNAEPDSYEWWEVLLFVLLGGFVLLMCAAGSLFN